MPEKRMECFRLLLGHLALSEHQFLRGIRDSRKVGSQCGMKRGVGGVKNQYTTAEWPKGQCQGYYVAVLREFRKRFGRKRPALFKSGQWHFHRDNAPVHNSILVTDYLTKIATKTVPPPPYSPDLAPCDFWLFPKPRGCRYEIIEEVKEVVMKVIDKPTEEDFHGAFQKLLERYNICITTWGDYFKGD